MIFNETVRPLIEPITPDHHSKLNIVYWLKWYFIIKPQKIKSFKKSMSKILDEPNYSNILKERANKK